MKNTSFNFCRFLALFLLLPLLPVRTVAQETYVPSPENLEARKLFAERRFGIFIHWGIYSLFAQGEWFMTNANINCREYAKAAQAFYPHRFNAEQWIAAFRDAGAKYVCFTSRHHDGFSMWKTDCSDYHIGNTPYGKDIIARLADACHEADMGFHLYYSHLDWTREDYPIGRTGRGTGRKGQADWNSYFRFMNN
ncbi:MAG: alpha-L-fucosidase, partial [Alloprevotella sp.]|nr:alpha-L-fucosidase [Alloprevotella sp.]